MKRIFNLLFLVLFSVAATLSAKDFYLAGSCNGWTPNNPSYKFTESQPKIYTLTLASLSGDFKIVTSAWEEQYGCKSSVKFGQTYEVVQSDNAFNITLPQDPAKNVTITFDYDKKTIRFDLSTSLYLIGDFNDWMILPKYEFSFNNGVYTLKTASFSGDFKVVTSDNREYGNGQKLSPGSETLLSANGANMKFDGTNVKSGMVLITVNPNSDLQDTPEEEKPNEGEVTPDDDNNPSTDPETPEEDNTENQDNGNQGGSTDNGDGGGSNDSQQPDNTETPDDNGGSSSDSPDEPGTEINPENPDSDAPEQTPDNDSPQTPDQGDTSDDNNGGSEDTPQPELPDNGDTDDNPEAGEPEIPDVSEEDPGAVDSIENDLTPPVYYDLNGRIVKNPGKGIFIKITGKKREKVIIGF